MVVRKEPAKGQNHMELLSEQARSHAGFWTSGRGNGQRKLINLDVKVIMLLCFRNIKQKNAASWVLLKVSICGAGLMMLLPSWREQTT